VLPSRGEAWVLAVLAYFFLGLMTFTSGDLLFAGRNLILMV
jgi:hypothetical protein